MSKDLVGEDPLLTGGIQMDREATSVSLPPPQCTWERTEQGEFKAVGV